MGSFRKEKVASVVRDVVSNAIAHRINDPRVEPLTTITRVEVTGDLLVARVFLSIPGGEARERLTMSALQHARGYVQRLVAENLNLRHCPELRFEVDASMKIALKTLTLIEQNRHESKASDGTQTPRSGEAEINEMNGNAPHESKSPSDLDPSNRDGADDRSRDASRQLPDGVEE